MSTFNLPMLRVLRALLIYALVVVAAAGIAAARMRAEARIRTEAAHPPRAETALPKPAKEYKPYFSLSTNRSYSTADRARVWINYAGIDHLDFRVYRVNDPVKFFKQLANPHQVGDADKQHIEAQQKGISFIEKLRGFKVSVFKAITNYFRSQLKRESRESLTQKLRGEGDRMPLNVADYARVPLLNPDQLASSWREKLPPLDTEYDTRMIMLGKRDPGVYLVEAVNGDLRAYTVAIVSDLTMIRKTSETGEILVYTVDRKSGVPREGVPVEIVQGERVLAHGTTDRSGILRTRVKSPKPLGSPQQEVDPEPGPPDEGASLVMARDHDHFAISDLRSYFGGYWGGEGGEGEDGDYEGGYEGPGGITSYIYTDRPIYRPAQKVFFKGILRRGGESGYEMVTGALDLTIEDPDNGKILERKLSLSSRGTFSGEVDIAVGARLGQYRILARSGESQVSSYFEVQEYKKPEYKVTVAASKKFARVGEKVKFSIDAKYFFGEPVKGADVTYYIYRSYYYPWWWESDEDREEPEDPDNRDEGYGYGNDMVKDGQATLNAKGHLEVEFDVPEISGDYAYRLEAQVTDEARRTIEARASFVGTRGGIVASTHTDRYVYYEGDTAHIRVQTNDYEGNPVSASLTLEIVRETWDKIEQEDKLGRKYYAHQTRQEQLPSVNLTTDQQGTANYDLRIPGSGSIHVKTLVKEGGKEYLSTTNYIWVADRNDEWSDWGYEGGGAIKLVPDKKSYQPGETAHVLAMLPTDKAHLLVTTELMGVMTARHVEARGRAVMIDVPIESRYAPNVYLGVAYVKDGELYTHDRLITVPARNKFLDVEILADKKEYKPRETARYTILARNTDGTPAPGAEVSLGVVDEAIYSLMPERARDIRKAFYGRRYNQVQTSFSVSYSFNGYSGKKPIQLASTRPAYQLADFKNEGQYAEPTIRKDFKDTTFWQPDVITGSDGKASVEVKLPDNLTTWRATARAVTADTRVGSAIAKVIARKDLILRLETPRFLTEGDTVTLSAIVHNYLDADKTTQISLEVTGARLLDTASQTVTIVKQGEHRIDWRVAANTVGEIKLLAKALTGQESDAVEIPLEVVPHVFKLAIASSTTLADTSAEKTLSLDVPASAQPHLLRIEVSPSLAGSLFGALDYLTKYPYGCIEQTMSSFLPNVIVAQALKELKTASLQANDLDKKVQSGLDRLYGFQHENGGWGWWANDTTNPFMTAYVVDGLWQASRAGFKVDRDRIKRGHQQLDSLIAGGRGVDGQPIDPNMIAYMVYALNETGPADQRYVDDLFAKREHLQPYGRALLALTLKLRGDEVRARQVAGEIEQSASLTDFDAHWESNGTGSYGVVAENNTEATALSLKALARIAPHSALLPKVARWLVGNRRNGYYWESTRQTAFAIFGLTDYLKVSKELSPDYTVEVYLNGEQALSRRMTAGDVTGAQTFVIERKGSQIAGSNRIRIVKAGPGVLYLSTSVSYYTRDEDIRPQSMPGLELSREYMRMIVVQPEGGGQGQWKLVPLTGELRSGDLIVSRLRIRGARAEHLMIEDPIPAGCEQIGQLSGMDFSYGLSGWSSWYSQREFRDQKTVFFVSYFDGDATFQYAMRVQVPGEFRVAPARAELMYQPHIQANAASGRMTILDKK